jgi:Rrf2 family protein
LNQIARAEGLSIDYAGKLMQLLRRAGLVKSLRGPGGGYRLAQPAKKISVWDVLEALGGPVFPGNFCSCHRGRARSCVHSKDCSLRPLWQTLDDVLQSFLERVSLADLVRNERPMAHWLQAAASKHIH